MDWCGVVVGNRRQSAEKYLAVGAGAFALDQKHKSAEFVLNVRFLVDFIRDFAQYEMIQS